MKWQWKIAYKPVSQWILSMFTLLSPQFRKPNSFKYEGIFFYFKKSNNPEVILEVRDRL